ncbi:MAG: hypothetical protein AB1710_07300 [Pseudomonadota bacterium]
MNLTFWKKKKAAEENSESASDEAVADASEADQPAKPGWLAHLKSRLKASKLLARKKRTPPEEEGSEPLAEQAGDDHPDMEPVLTVKRGKWRPLALALLIVLAGGGGFAARAWLSPPQPQKTHLPAPAAAPLPVTAIPRPAASSSPDKAEIEALKKRNQEMQAQIEVLKKQNQEMQAQAEAVKNQGKSVPPVTASTPPARGGVMTISGKESAEGLKKAIEEMNASDSRSSRKLAK